MCSAVVTGIGLITAIGNNVEENLRQLRSGSTGIGKAHHLNSRFADIFLFGEVALGNETLISESDLSDTEGLTRTELLAIKAFKEAVSDAGLGTDDVTGYDTAFISASTVGGMVETESLYLDANLNTEPSGFQNSYTSGSHTLRMARIFGIKGYTDTINTACSSSANAIMLGTRLIRSGRVKRAIVGGVDSLSKYTVNGFNSLQIFSDELTAPFDAARKGLNLGEGAAYLVLENEDAAKGKRTYGQISGYGNCNDAYHASSMSPEAVGVRGAIGQALQTAQLDASDISLINTHGTGTRNNDHTELYGFHKVFSKTPPYISTKSYTGHTLAASGAVEAIFSLLSICNHEIHPSLNFKHPMPEFDSKPQTELVSGIDIAHVLSNSFGFGGNCSSLILSKF